MEGALSVSLPLVAYESGQQILNIGDTFTLYTMTAASTDSRFGTAMQSYYAALKTAGLTGVMDYFYDVGAWLIFGIVGNAAVHLRQPDDKTTGHLLVYLRASEIVVALFAQARS